MSEALLHEIVNFFSACFFRIRWHRSLMVASSFSRQLLFAKMTSPLPLLDSSRKGSPERRPWIHPSLSVLLEELHLNNANASCLTLAPHLGGILAGLQGGHQSRFQVVSRLEASVLEFLLLVSFPIVIL